MSDLSPKTVSYSDCNLHSKGIVLTGDFKEFWVIATNDSDSILNRSILFQTDYSLKKYRSNLRKNMFSAVLF